MKDLIKNFDNFLSKVRIIYLVFILILVGIGILYSASYYFSSIRFHNEFYYVEKHLFRIAIGLFIFILMCKTDIEFFKRDNIRVVLWFLVIALLLGVLIFGRKEAGAKRWIEIGGISFQPAEICRILLIIYVANLIENKRSENERRSALFGLFSLLLLGSFFIFKQPNLSMALIFIFLGLFLMWISGMKVRRIILFLIILFLGGVFYVRKASPSYALKRIRSYTRGKLNYQVRQARSALSGSKLLGTGPLKGKVRLLYLPKLYTDFIFVIVGEEEGLLGTLFLLFIYFLLFLKGFLIARYCFIKELYFEGVIAAGVVFNIFLSFAVHVSAVLGIIPTTGMPLPFISFGGSSLISNLFGLGLVCSIERRLEI